MNTQAYLIIGTADTDYYAPTSEYGNIIDALTRNEEWVFAKSLFDGTEMVIRASMVESVVQSTPEGLAQKLELFAREEKMKRDAGRNAGMGW